MDKPLRQAFLIVRGGVGLRLERNAFLHAGAPACFVLFSVVIPLLAALLAAGCDEPPTGRKQVTLAPERETLREALGIGIGIGIGIGVDDGLQLPCSRTHEREADRIGRDLALLNGDSSGMRTTWLG